MWGFMEASPTNVTIVLPHLVEMLLSEVSNGFYQCTLCLLSYVCLFVCVCVHVCLCVYVFAYWPLCPSACLCNAFLWYLHLHRCMYFMVGLICVNRIFKSARRVLKHWCIWWGHDAKVLSLLYRTRLLLEMMINQSWLNQIRSLRIKLMVCDYIFQYRKVFPP